MKPGENTVELIAQLCASRAAESAGLPIGCMPDSPCAAAHLSPAPFWIIFAFGLLLGASLAHFWFVVFVARVQK